MNQDLGRTEDYLNRRFFLDFPIEAARKIEQLSLADVAEAVSRQPVPILAHVWHHMLPGVAARLMGSLADEICDGLLAELSPQVAARVLGHMTQDDRTRRLARLDPAIGNDLKAILTYPPDTAGRLMDTSVATFRRDATAGETLQRLRMSKMKTARSLFLVDEAQHLVAKVALENIALAPPETALSALEQPITALVRPTDTLQDITDAFETKKILDLPVVDLDGVFLGAVTHSDIAPTIQADATVDIQTMVGASREERALSNPFFTVRKRLPWLHINLVTAFMAAAVVGLFESTVAQVTALAVLLPVVAGQSGNAGAQALAVTMRGLALREITTRQGARVMRKEVVAGVLNGLAIALTCGIGVYVWSQSLGLVVVITTSMVIAMTAAGFAGAVIPVVLTRLGQDPATSSSIILTTVTDIAGFFSFLGIASLLMKYL